MTTFAELCKFTGEAISPVFNLSLPGNSAISEVNWTETVPLNTSLEIQYNISLDTINWIGWNKLYNGSFIKELDSDYNLDNILLQFKIIFNTKNVSAIPVLHSFNVEIIPVVKFENLGDRNCKPEIWIEKTGENGGITIRNLTTSKDFIFSNGENAKANFTLSGTVYNGETITIGNDIYEFNTGYGNVDEGNILVDISSEAESARGTLSFTGDIYDGETITIGSDIYEFDYNNNYFISNIQVDLSDYVSYAKSELTFNNNLLEGDTINIGAVSYVFVSGTESLDTANRVLIGITKEETLNNLFYAINDSGLEGTLYGLGTLEHPEVRAEKISTDKLSIIAKVVGSTGNGIATTSLTLGAAFNNSTTSGGTDCSIDDVINVLVNTINNRVDAIDYLVENFDLVLDTITICAKVPGSKGNSIITTENCTNAFWSSTSLLGGVDPTIDLCLNNLQNQINTSPLSVENVSATVDLNNKVLIVTANDIGNSYIFIQDNLFNGSWDSFSLYGGTDTLIAGETVYIDCENEYIESDQINTYRDDVFNGNFLEFESKSINTLEIIGKCRFKLRYRFKTIQG